MKYFKIFAILLLSSVVSFYSCDDKPTSKVGEIPESQEVSNSSTQASSGTSDSTTPTTSQNASGVYHYTCSNGCEGGAASAVNCANCGLLLTHNPAFHSNTNSTTTPSTTTPTPLLDASTTGAATNAAGVFHYTCPKGCAGGAGSAGTCATCGTTLAHNPAYH